ncbi:hypothetical protein O181_000419 [Austropuccinia psidii MF-1]|uniref:Uncharacterized protein n=1 Tax=Austropuccinia psidii MF-1 TaxID=1389203 RepID=A0A9Q3GAW9_9BASI|nr:hypothetical protein [Austropuccinia psidii MF-1]
MPGQHSPPGKNTRSQKNQAVLTPKTTALSECTPSFHQLSANVYRGPPMKEDTPPEEEVSRLEEAEDEEGEESVEEEESEETKVEAS